MKEESGDDEQQHLRDDKNRKLKLKLKMMTTKDKTIRAKGMGN